MQLILGVEGGGTKTDWVLISRQDETDTVLSRGQLPAANMKLITPQELERILRSLPGEATHVGVFLAGCATVADRTRLAETAASIWPDARVSVGSDRDSGLATAFGNGDGIAVIAGTGSAVHGRRGTRIEKAGGWGQLLGDHGSGYDLAMQALRHSLRIYDLEQKTTPLARTLLQTLGLNQLGDLVIWVRDADKLAVAKLTPAIFQAAAAGEPEVIAIIETGAAILAGYTRAVAARLGLAAPNVRLLGGLFVNHPEYVAAYRRSIGAYLPEAAVDLCDVPGSLGAAWIASGGTMNPACTVGAQNQQPLRDLGGAATEQINPRSENLDRLDTPALVDLFVTEESRVTEALAGARHELAAGVNLITEALRTGGRLFYTGAGTSGRLGVLDASEIPPTFGTSPDLVQGIIAGGADALHKAVEGAEDRDLDGALTVVDRGVRAGDVVCGIAASGRTPFVLGSLKEARQLGAGTILLSCNPARPRQTPPWDIEIDLDAGPEILTGSTRLKAGTATKVALNILSTCAMVRLGRVRGNLMLDLDVSNAKLRDRATRMLAHLKSVSYADAAALLARHAWNIRAALGEEGAK